MMPNAVNILAAILLVNGVTPATAAVAKSKLINKFNTCHPKDIDFQKCFKKSVEDALAFIAKGNREFNIVPLEPLHVPRLEIGDSSGPVGFMLTFDKCDFYGLGDLKVVSAKTDLEKHIIDITLKLPHTIIIGKYEIEGRILLLPIRGRGNINMTCDKPEIDWKIQGKPVEKNGVIHFDVQKFKLTHRIPGGSIHLTNLFDGDKRLGDAMNIFLNENFKDVLGMVMADFDETMGEVMKGLSKRIFDQLPYNEIFPGV